ncbi:extracellular solute-binding protein [Streptomyces sp. NPDC001508]|uniref:extracellular solute-binding protein n=1 Tax=Streptomyces sp. NPDC001508 TaxID=3154656 RepID=UPI00331CB34B
MTSIVSRRTLLLAAGAAAVTTACGRETSDALRFLVPSGVRAQAVGATLGPDFTRRTGISVELQLSGAGGNWTDVDGRLATAFAAGTPPAMAVVGANAVLTYAAAGLLQPLEPLMAQGDFRPDDYIKPFRRVNQYGGHTVAALYSLGAMVFSYNADAFRKAGLDPDRPPATWREMRSAAAAVVSRRAARYGVLHSYNADSNWTFENFIGWAGGSLMDARRRRITFADRPGVDVLTYWRDLITDKLSTPTTTLEMDDAFLRGDAAMVFGPSTKPVRYAKEASFDCRTAVVPIPDGGTRRLPPGGGSLVIFTKDKGRQRAAWQIIQALISAPGQTELCTNTGEIPVNVRATGARYLGPVIKEQPYRRPALDSVPDLAQRFQFPGLRAVQINDLLQQNIYAALTGAKEPRQALNDAARRAEALLA